MVSNQKFVPPPVSAMESIKDTGAERLLMSCLGMLARVYPRGLTARELVDELVKEDSSFELTSSLLSSKLNTVFRRLHNERGAPTAQQLVDLPMTRKMTEDKRKRLIYHYAPPPDSPQAEAEAEAAEDTAEIPAEVPAEAEQPPPASTAAAEPSKAGGQPPKSTTASPEVPPPLDTPRSRLSSLEEPATPQTPTSPKRKLEDKPESRKKYSRNSFNPYYDALTMDAPLPLPQLATAPQSPANWGEEMSEFEAPELIDLDALDACF